MAPAAVAQALTSIGAHAIFRATLDALARPGTIRRLPTAAVDPMAGQVPATLLPVLALADLTTPTCVLDDEASPGWQEIVRVSTSAPPAALSAARLVAALRVLAPGELASLRTGSVAAPEHGATASLSVAGIAIANPAKADPAKIGQAKVDPARADPASVGPGGDHAATADEAGDATATLLSLSGPGIQGTTELLVTGLAADFVAERNRLVSGFPAGADLLLITADGAITGLPRTTIISEGTA